MRILIVEDNIEIATNMADFLSSRSHIVDFTELGGKGREMIKQHDYDVIVLDLMLPDIDGITLCKQLRADPLSGDIPVLMLTARDTLEDKLSGFDAGADDYLVKPFSLLELDARLNALNQRRSLAGQSRILRFADITYDLNAVEIHRGKRAIHLSDTQRAILLTLLRANGKTVTRRELTETIWGDHPPDADALSVHIHALRGALHGPEEPDVLLTIRSVGYRLMNPE